MSEANAPAEVVAPAAPPRPTTCRTFVPADENTIVVGQQEFDTPDGLDVTNWAAADVAHKDREGTPARPPCRAAADITELIVHETVSPRIARNGTGRPNVQIVLHRDGTFTQHADLVHDLNHAAPHNSPSFGFETVNPVHPRIAGAPQNGLPADLDRWPVIQNTNWNGNDRHDPDRHRVRNPDTGEFEVVNGPLPREPWNRDRHYVRPTDAQLESAKRLIEWATDDTVGHGMAIPLDWVGLRRGGELLLFGRDDALFRTGNTPILLPGIYAHGYFRHADGWFIVLYAWLRLDHGLDEAQAVTAAIDLAANHTIHHQEPGGARKRHADLTHAPAPAPAPPAPGPPP